MILFRRMWTSQRMGVRWSCSSLCPSPGSSSPSWAAVEPTGRAAACWPRYEYVHCTLYICICTNGRKFWPFPSIWRNFTSHRALQLASSVKYNEIRQNFSNSVWVLFYSTWLSLGFFSKHNSLNTAIIMQYSCFFCTRVISYFQL